MPSCCQPIHPVAASGIMQLCLRAISPRLSWAPVNPPSGLCPGYGLPRTDHGLFETPMCFCVRCERREPRWKSARLQDVVWEKA